MKPIFDHTHPPTVLRVKVTANAKTPCIKKEIEPDGSLLYKVYVTVVAEDGKANKEVLKLLAKDLGVPKSSLVITRGITSREKVIRIKR